MEKSLFIEYVSKVWPRLSLYVRERYNRLANKPTYLHKQWLTRVYSADQKWEGTSANTSYVMADIVALDSPLPVKKRDAIATASGKLPKIGMKKKLSETDINNINIMIAQLATIDNANGRRDQLNRIFNNILDDGNKCSVGIDERCEAIFLEGLSSGVVAVPDEDNVGTAIRVNYGYYPGNTFGVEKKGEVSADDIERVTDKINSDGNTAAYGLIDLATHRKLRKSRWARELVASSNNQSFTDDTVLKVPTAAEFNAAVQDEYGFQFYTIDRSCLVEKDGKRKSIKPFKANRIVFLPSIDNVGSLVWSNTAEATRRVSGVEYSVVDEYKLISRFSQTDPLQEFTMGQALILPVIENVDQIYVLDFDEALEVDTEAEGSDTSDTNVTIWGRTYVKADMISALQSLGSDVKAGATDAEVIAAVNRLDDLGKKALAGMFPAIDVTKLSFTSAADHTGKNVTVTGKGTVTATSDQTGWCTTSVSGKTVTVKVQQNSSAARTANVKITQNNRSVVVSVSQEAGE